MRGDALNGSPTDDSARTAVPHPPVLTALDRATYVGSSDELLPPFLASRRFAPPVAVEARLDPALDVPSAFSANGEAARSQPDDADDFPADAFLVPEDSEPAAEARPATGPSGPTPPPAKQPIREAAVQDVAARLERLASRLRREGLDAVPGTVGEGDRFDALLVGIVAGFLAADRD